MMDIKTWLEEIGMGEHWEKFEINKIDEDTLKSMTENDLKDIGVDALGDRKTLIAGISKLNGESSSGDGGGAGKGALLGGLIGGVVGIGGCAAIVGEYDQTVFGVGLVVGLPVGAILGAIIKK